MVFVLLSPALTIPVPILVTCRPGRVPRPRLFRPPSFVALAPVTRAILVEGMPRGRRQTFRLPATVKPCFTGLQASSFLPPLDLYFVKAYNRRPETKRQENTPKR